MHPRMGQERLRVLGIRKSTEGLEDAMKAVEI